jgi:hypothetical protein
VGLDAALKAAWKARWLDGKPSKVSFSSFVVSVKRFITSRFTRYMVHFITFFRFHFFPNYVQEAQDASVEETMRYFYQFTYFHVSNVKIGPSFGAMETRCRVASPASPATR